MLSNSRDTNSEEQPQIRTKEVPSIETITRTATDTEGSSS